MRSIWPGFVALLTGLVLCGGCAPHLPASDASTTGQPPETLELLRHDAVLVRGWIGAAELGLEPILVTDARPTSFDSPDGPYRLRGLDADGTVRFDLRFDDDALASIAGREGHHFMFVVPVGEGGSLWLSSVELEAGEGRRFVSEARLPAEGLRAALTSTEAVVITREPQGQLRVQWDAERFPLLQLRDPESGTILALARHGDVTIPATQATLEVALSEGVRSAAARMQPR